MLRTTAASVYSCITSNRPVSLSLFWMNRISIAANKMRCKGLEGSNCNRNRWATQCEIWFRVDARSGAGIHAYFWPSQAKPSQIVSYQLVQQPFGSVRSSGKQTIHHNRVHTYRPRKGIIQSNQPINFICSQPSKPISQHDRLERVRPFFSDDTIQSVRTYITVRPDNHNNTRLDLT